MLCAELCTFLLSGRNAFLSSTFSFPFFFPLLFLEKNFVCVWQSPKPGARQADLLEVGERCTCTHAHTHTRACAPHTHGGDYVLPSARLEHSVVWLIRPGTLMDEHIQPANKFTQLQFGTPLMRSYVHSAGWRANVCPPNLSPSFPLSLQTASS